MLGLRFVRGLSLAAASGGHSSSRCGDRSSSQCVGLSLSRPLLLRSTGSRRAGSVAVAHGPNCSVACGILPDQGSNLCPPHQQADSQPLRHQGSPRVHFFLLKVFIFYLFFIFGCIGSSLLCVGFLQLWRAGAALPCGAWALGAQASVIVARGLSSCGLQALAHRLSSCGARAQLLCGMWESSLTRARTHVACIGRRILNYCATKEALSSLFRLSQSKVLFHVPIPLWCQAFDRNSVGGRFMKMHKKQEPPICLLK